MSLVLKELDSTTREYMLKEFDAELAAVPYRPTALTPSGDAEWPGLLRAAIVDGDDSTLADSLLARSELLIDEEEYVRGGVTRRRQVNKVHAARRLAMSEFNTWYVRGLSSRLIAEGVAKVRVYRAAEAKWSPAGCETHEGEVFAVEDVYGGHRARYWPVPNDSAFSIPFQAGCHHTIERFED